jgi:hypothetical protein
VVTVENAEAPRGQHQQPRAGKQNPNQLDRQLAFRAGKSGRDCRNQQRRGEHAEEHQHRDDERPERTDRAGNMVGLLAVAARDERGVHGDERRGQRAFTEQVLQKVGNPKRRVERIRGVRFEAEVVREDLEANEPGEPAEKNARGDEDGAAPRHRYCVARGASYPSFSVPDFVPFTAPCVSHSSDARNNSR